MKQKPSARIREIATENKIPNHEAVPAWIIASYLDEIHEAEQKEIEKGGITPKVNGLDNVVLCKEPQIIDDLMTEKEIIARNKGIEDYINKAENLIFGAIGAEAYGITKNKTKEEILVDLHKQLLQDLIKLKR